jgi:hypothetical protein
LILRGGLVTPLQVRGLHHRARRSISNSSAAVRHCGVSCSALGSLVMNCAASRSRYSESQPPSDPAHLDAVRASTSRASLRRSAASLLKRSRFFLSVASLLLRAQSSAPVSSFRALPLGLPRQRRALAWVLPSDRTALRRDVVRIMRAVDDGQ